MSSASIVAACLFVLTTYIIFAATTNSETSGQFARDAYYNRLVDGLKQGHLYIDKEPPAALLALPDPYDRSANAQARGVSYTPTAIHDLSLYNGKLYLYFSVIPAVLLFLPFNLITGAYLSHQYACALFTSVAFLAGAGLLICIWRRFFSSLRPITIALCLLTFGLASLQPILLHRPDVYEVPISCAFMFTMLALCCLWRATESRLPSWPWVAGLSLCVGLAIGSRPSDLPSAGLLLFPILLAARSQPAEKPRRIRALALTIGSAAIPIFAVGAGLLAYNYARFGNPAEFGTHYQLHADPRDIPPFDIRNIPYNIWMYFLHFPGGTAHFPFAGPWASAWPKPATIAAVEFPIGLLLATPVVWFAGAFAFGWRLWDLRLRLVCAALGWLGVTNAALLCCYSAPAARYQLSFAPIFVLLAVIGIFHCESRLTRHPRTIAPTGIRCAWIVASLFSVAYVGLFAVRQRGYNYATEALIVFMEQHDEATAIVKYRRGLALDPDYTAARRVLARLELRADLKPEAESDYRVVLAQDPEDAHALNGLGALLASEPGREKEAIACLREAVALAPGLAEAHNNLAVTLSNDPARRDDAIEQFRAAIRINPSYKAPRILLAALLEQNEQQITEAVEQYRELLSLPNSTEEQLTVHRLLAASLLRQGRSAEVIREYSEILRLAPNDAQIQNNLGALLSRDPARREEAIVRFRAAIRLAPDYVEAHSNLAATLAQDPPPGPKPSPSSKPRSF